MSLTARIALPPSRRIAIVECIVALGAVVVATLALAQRFPDALPWSIAAALTLLTAVIARTIAVGAHERIVLMVSDRPEVEVASSGSSDGAWRLAESTVAWPGFAVLALARDGHRRVLRRPVVTAELPPVDRRALARFLTWSMRAHIEGGVGDSFR